MILSNSPNFNDNLVNYNNQKLLLGWYDSSGNFYSYKENPEYYAVHNPGAELVWNEERGEYGYWDRETGVWLRGSK